MTYKKRELGYFSQKACDLYGFSIYKSEKDPDVLVHVTYRCIFRLFSDEFEMGR